MSGDDELGSLLNAGWEIAGYDVAMMAMGATAQYILLRKGNSLGTFSIVINGGQELARGFSVLTPKAPTPPQTRLLWLNARDGNVKEQ